MGKKAAEEMAERLALMKAGIAALQDRLKAAKGEVKEELDRRLEEASLREPKQSRKLQEFKEAGLKEWDALGRRAEKAWRDLEQALEEIAARLKGGRGH
jgi:hypothetical protein